MGNMSVQLGIITALVSMIALPIACTNRIPTSQSLVSISPNTASTGALTYVSNVQFQGQNSGSTLANTAISQLQRVGNTLYATGTPFGFMAMDISANPSHPTLLYDAKDNISQFSPTSTGLGFWDPSEEASGALTVLGNFAIMSGRFAASVVNVTGQIPIEEIRYDMPQVDSNGNESQGADAAYIWTAVVAHPTLALLYAFTQNSYLYQFTMNSAPQLAAVSRSPYSSSGTVCCVSGATVFSNVIAVAMTNKLWFFDVGSTGTLSNWIESDALQATLVATSDDHLYIYHSPQAGNITYARGIYAINSSGDADAFYPIANLYQFAVAHDNSYIYTNEDNVMMRVYSVNAGAVLHQQQKSGSFSSGVLR
jgi:hypothetical protein